MTAKLNALHITFPAIITEIMKQDSQKQLLNVNFKYHTITHGSAAFDRLQGWIPRISGYQICAHIQDKFETI